jgi:hypothetical protein
MDIISSSLDQIGKIRMDGWILYSILIISGMAAPKYRLELVKKFNIDN